jgi:hypothetical protein
MKWLALCWVIFVTAVITMFIVKAAGPIEIVDSRTWKFHAMSEGPALRETCLNGDRIYALANTKDEYPRAMAVVKAGCRP